MTLHIFNPEHDIALAANLSNFTAPLAGRQLRHDLSWLPELWAEDGDVILTDDVKHIPQTVTEVCPWGWDRALCAQLRRLGVSEALLPTDDWLQGVRALSHRRTAARLLPHLQMEGTVGEAFECESVEEVMGLLQRYERLVLKAPWSSSGRGVRFVDVGSLRADVGGMKAEVGGLRADVGGLKAEVGGLRAEVNWMRKVISTQGSIMVEPRYEKVMDFAMEFTATESGIRYEGLSLFATNKGAYTGNILATEDAKRRMISGCYPVGLLDIVREKIVSFLNLFDYQGPFGVDMMFVRAEDNSKTSRLLLHPCVEINLRRTMGHVALAMTKRVNPQADDSLIGEMTITFDGSHYRLTCQKATAAAAATLSESTP